MRPRLVVSRRPTAPGSLGLAASILLVAATWWLAPAYAQTVGDRTVRTSFEAATAAERVTFRRRAPRVGDQADQSLTVKVQLDSRIRTGQTIVGETKTSMTQRVQRMVTTSDVSNQQSVAANVRYLVSEREVQADGEGGALQQDPIAGRSYRCRRDGERLVVTDDAGLLPTLAEFKIVAESMESLGKPNPLAEFLSGRTIAVGEAVSLPKDVAQEFAQRMGEGIDQVERFELTLAEIKPLGGRKCAVFQAVLEASENGSRQMKMQLVGPLAIELASCRMVEANLNGPIGMAETAMSMGETYHVTGTGRMGFVIASTYDDAK